jgi:hypothetical protein
MPHEKQERGERQGQATSSFFSSRLGGPADTADIAILFLLAVFLLAVALSVFLPFPSPTLVPSSPR